MTDTAYWIDKIHMMYIPGKGPMPKRIRKPGSGVPVVCKDILTGAEMRWPSMIEAAEAIHGSESRISAACSTGKPYRGAIWDKEPKPKKVSCKNGK